MSQTFTNVNSAPTDKVVAVVGLGYVGLPLALAFGKKMKTIGYDLSEQKIKAYRDQIDPTGEMETEAFRRAPHVNYTLDPQLIGEADFTVVVVPTPVDAACNPDFSALVSASQTVGKYLKKGAVVIYESTVYPGATEEICVPVLEKASGLKCGTDFSVGYSPERINPGDKEHSLSKVKKVVSGQDGATLEKVAWLYEQIIEAGVHKTSSIKVAEAAKVIENTQRDLNIALMNELAILFKRMDLDTMEVLEAAGTKWNFLKFSPGLVGGHCIGVDPYYLTHKAKKERYDPQIILAGRRINDFMGEFIAEQTVKELVRNSRPIRGAKVLVLGLTFKENICDLRNSKVVDIVTELEKYGVNVFVFDPVAKPEDAENEYGIKLCDWKTLRHFDGVIAAVPHAEILNLDLQDLALRMNENPVFMDVKSRFERKTLLNAGFSVWRL